MYFLSSSTLLEIFSARALSHLALIARWIHPVGHHRLVRFTDSYNGYGVDFEPPFGPGAGVLLLAALDFDLHGVLGWR